MSVPRFRSVGSVTLNVTRQTQGSYSNTSFDYTAGTTSTLTIKANVQPATKYQTLQLPEADRTKASIAIWTVSELRVQREGTGGNGADLISWNGEVWEVMQVERWQMGVLDHYHAIAVRRERT